MASVNIKKKLTDASNFWWLWIYQERQKGVSFWSLCNDTAAVAILTVTYGGPVIVPQDISCWTAQIIVTMH